MLPDLPVHGDSEDRPRHPYTLDWLAEVMAAFCRETCGAHPIVGGHGAGAEILLRAVSTGQLQPARIVLMPNRLHCPPPRSRLAVPLRAVAPRRRCRASTARRRARCAWPTGPSSGMKLTARGNPAARDLVRHATADVAGNANLARSWSRWVRRWPAGAQTDLLDAYPRIEAPVLLLWADRDRYHPLAGAEQALDLLPDGQLRVLPGTGFLIAYDDPVGVARELTAFCLCGSGCGACRGGRGRSALMWATGREGVSVTTARTMRCVDRAATRRSSCGCGRSCRGCRHEEVVAGRETIASRSHSTAAAAGRGERFARTAALRMT